MSTLSSRPVAGVASRRPIDAGVVPLANASERTSGEWSADKFMASLLARRESSTRLTGPDVRRKMVKTSGRGSARPAAFSTMFVEDAVDKPANG